MPNRSTAFGALVRQSPDVARERLLKQFNAMDALVSQLNSTSDRLTQSLGSLPGFVKQDS